MAIDSHRGSIRAVLPQSGKKHLQQFLTVNSNRQPFIWNRSMYTFIDYILFFFLFFIVFLFIRALNVAQWLRIDWIIRKNIWLECVNWFYFWSLLEAGAEIIIYLQFTIQMIANFVFARWFGCHCRSTSLSLLISFPITIWERKKNPFDTSQNTNAKSISNLHRIIFEKLKLNEHAFARHTVKHLDIWHFLTYSRYATD